MISPVTLDDSNFLLYAATYYRNPGLHEDAEFMKDIDRIKCVEKLMQKYRRNGTMNIRLILNHLTILFNVFDERGCQQMLIFKLCSFLDVLIPFLAFIHKMPKDSRALGIEVPLTDIPPDDATIQMLRELRRVNL
jgi:hypothetical protein